MFKKLQIITKETEIASVNDTSLQILKTNNFEGLESYDIDEILDSQHNQSTIIWRISNRVEEKD